VFGNFVECGITRDLVSGVGEINKETSPRWWQVGLDRGSNRSVEVRMSRMSDEV
jgi:hypothetical protein